MSLKTLIAGNWKMNPVPSALGPLLEGLVKGQGSGLGHVELLVCPPAVYLPDVIKALKGTGIAVGAQDCSAHASGAYTGEIAAHMIKEMGGSHVILGHSERRQYHHETDDLVARKAAIAHAAGLVAIICVGETWAERLAGQQEAVVEQQLSLALPEGASASNTVIAYEPVWAIGTGQTATPADAGAMHGFIRKKLKTRMADGANVRILYGGSMKADNAKALLATAEVNGGLIGGASLDPAAFMAIAKSA